MTIVDTSAWVEYLRGTNSRTHATLLGLIQSGNPILTTDVIVMEVLAGGRNFEHTTSLHRMLAMCEFIPTAGLSDYQDAAALYRICRSKGATIRSLNDCLIATIAIRTGNALLHNDTDFDAISANSNLKIY